MRGTAKEWCGGRLVRLTGVAEDMARDKQWSWAHDLCIFSKVFNCVFKAGSHLF